MKKETTMKGEVEMLTVFVLARRGEATAYGIRKAIEEITGEKKSFGALYPALRRLEERGIVDAQTEGKRKIYRLTEKGRDSVRKIRKRKKEFLKRMEELSNAVSEMFGAPAISIGKIFSPSFKFHAELMKLLSLLEKLDERDVGKAKRAMERAINEIAKISGKGGRNG